MSMIKCQCGKCDYCIVTKKLVAIVDAMPNVVCQCHDDFVNSDSVVIVNMLNEDMSPSYSISQCSICGCMEIDEPIYHFDYDEDYEDDYEDCPYCADHDDNEDRACLYCGRNV